MNSLKMRGLEFTTGILFLECSLLLPSLKQTISLESVLSNAVTGVHLRRLGLCAKSLDVNRSEDLLDCSDSDSLSESVILSVLSSQDASTSNQAW